MAAIKHPVYALVGEEPVRRRQLLDRLRVLAGDVERVSASDRSPDDVAQSTLLADPDTPLIRIVDNYAAWKPAQRKRMAEIAADMLPGVVVIILAKTLGAKDPLRSALPADAVLSCAAPDTRGFPAWAVEYAKASGATLDRDAAAELLARVGERTAKLSAEIDKLAAAASDRRVTAEIVRALTDSAVERDGWALTDAIVAGDRVTAFEQLAALEGGSLSPLALTGALSSRLVPIAWCALGVSMQDAGAKPYAWRKAQDAVRAGWTAERVRATLLSLADCEAQLRGGSTLPEWVVFAAWCARQLPRTSP